MNHKLASIDLGSNTFRLAVGHLDQTGKNNVLTIDDQMRELISLANGLDANNCLSQTAMNQALASLQRFGHKLADLKKDQVRAVATNTFRIASNINEFLPLAEQALGFPIEIISGIEEARLIYLGVTQSVGIAPINRFIMDIGGGSTEYIIGNGTQPLKLASLSMGCTSWTNQFFQDGHINHDNMARAINAANTQLSSIASNYKAIGWQQAYGSSGTAKGVLAVLEDNNFSSSGINLAAMHKLKEELIKIGRVNLHDWAGLKEERAPLLAGGLAILIAAFEQLEIDVMYAGDGALRIGILYDMLNHTKMPPITTINPFQVQ